MGRTKITAFLLITATSFLVLMLFILPSSKNQKKVSERQIYNPVKEVINSMVKEEKKYTTIIFTGDVMLGRSVMASSLDAKDNYYPFRKVSDFLKTGDITFINLENPIVKNCPRHIGGFKFCTSYEIADGLGFSGIDVITLANNHTTNYGKDGFNETINYLSSKGIKSVGYSNLEVVEKNGIKFGFLGFDYTITRQNLEKDLVLIKDSDSKVDVLIVGSHWGDEYKSIANNFQVSTAQKMVENGADVIIGHHPHWVENYEEINGVPVYYSLGNFIFDQAWSEETKKGLVVKFTFDGGKIVNKEEYKTYTPIKGQPEILFDNNPN